MAISRSVTGGYSFETYTKYFDPSQPLISCSLADEPVKAFDKELKSYSDKVEGHKIYVGQNTDEWQQNPMCVKVMNPNLDMPEFGSKIELINPVACEVRQSSGPKAIYIKADDLKVVK